MGKLTLTRCENTTLKIGENITIYVEKARNRKAVLAIEAPPDMVILRDDAIKRETTEELKQSRSQRPDPRK